MKGAITHTTKSVTTLGIELSGDEVAQIIAEYISKRKKIKVHPDDVSFHADCDCVYSATVNTTEEHITESHTSDIAE